MLKGSHILGTYIRVLIFFFFYFVRVPTNELANTQLPFMDRNGKEEGGWWRKERPFKVLAAVIIITTAIITCRD